MVAKPLDERAIFKVARRIESAEVRTEYLKQVCGGDEALFDRMVTLLRVHDDEPEFLESMPPAFLDGNSPAVAPTIDQPASQEPGTMIGPYKLYDQIGEGGMGLVYRAVQKEPIRRKVALKIIKPGMDSRQVINRFEAERQALALMDHPNIARVIDAGTTESGRPYFVMELVKGMPITGYCDRYRLTTDERLALFGDVCSAVQHAHQKGIIHRDLKPSNILVTLLDGKAIPKVIDFGIAKAVSGHLTDNSLVTAHTQMVGTPLYMSPEQADLSAVDVDTRSDVYSLGVLLYELLTGTTPFDGERMSSVSFDEFRRIVREEDPPRPSARLSTLDAALETVADKHHTDPRTLSREVAGELDWIVMKALEKDRTRRYESASELAKDVQRHLDGEAVEACPPSVIYRSRKFVRRNRVVLGFATTITTAFVLVCLALIMAFRGRADTLQARLDLQATETSRLAEQERQRAAERAQENARLDALMLEGLQLASGYQPDFPAAVRNLTEVLKNRPDDATAYLHRGSIYYRWGRPVKAIQDLGQSLERSPEDNLAAHQLMAVVAQQLGRKEEAAEHLALAEAADPNTVEAIITNALALNDRQGLELLTKAIERQPFDAVLHRHRGQLALAVVFQEGGTSHIVQQAVSDLNKALKAFPGDRATLTPLCYFLVFHSSLLPEIDCRARCDEIVDAWLKAAPHDEVGLRYQMLNHWHLKDNPEKAIAVGLKAHNLYPRNPVITGHLAECYAQLQRFDEAEEFFTKWIELLSDPRYPYICRGICRINMGRREAAREDLDHARTTGEGSDWLAHQWKFLIRGYIQLGDLETAETLARKWVAQRPEAPQPHHLLAECYTAQERWNDSLLELSQAIDLDPQAPHSFVQRADLYAAKLNDSEKALADYSKCVELDPRDLSFRAKRAAVLGRLGRDEVARADCEVAVDLLIREIEADPTRPIAWLIEAVASHNRWGLELLTKAIEKQPQDPALRRLRGQLAQSIIEQYGDTELVPSSVADLETALKASPTDRTILVPLCHMLIFQGHLVPKIDAKVRCKQLLDAWLETWPDDLDGLRYLAAYYHYVARDFDQAIEIGLKAHALYPLVSIFLIEIGECYQATRRFQEAEEFFTKAIEVAHDFMWPHVQRGWCRMELNRLEAAREDFDQACKCGVKSQWLAFEWKRLINGYSRLGDMEAAESLAREWIALSPHAALPHQILAHQVYMKQERWNDALSELSLAIDLDPQEPIFYNLRVVVYARLQNYEQSLGDCTKCIELEPEDVKHPMNRAIVLKYLGRDEEARADLEMAVDLLTRKIGADPSQVNTLHLRAGTRKRLGDWEGAIKDEQQCLLLDPKYVPALNDLASLLITCPNLGRRDPEMALSLAKQAVGLAGDYFVVWHTLGAVQYRNADYAGAIKSLERSSELLGTNSAQIDFFLAMSHWQQGDQDKARVLYRRAVEEMEQEGASRDEELLQYRMEAEQLMDLEDTSVADPAVPKPGDN